MKRAGRFVWEDTDFARLAATGIAKALFFVTTLVFLPLTLIWVGIRWVRSAPQSGKGVYRMINVLLQDICSGGRLPRLRFFLYWLPLAICNICIAVVISWFELSFVQIALLSAVSVAIIIGIFHLAVRRLHDLNWTGWASLLLLVPFISLIMLGILLFGKGSDGPNRYGEAPEALTAVPTASVGVDKRAETLVGQGTLTQGTRAVATHGLPSRLPVAWLQVKSDAGSEEAFPIHSPSVTIGRAPDNDLVIDDPTVSRHHARISFEGGGYSIQDLGSRSGIMVDGHSIPRARLTSSTGIQLGETTLVFMQEETGEVTRAAEGGPVVSPQSAGETVVLGGEPGMLTWLAVTTGPVQGKTFQLKAGINTIGRDPDNDVVIPDSSVSRHHAVVRVEERRVLLADVGSSSGTSIDGRPVGGRALKVGESISMGQSRLRLLEVEGQGAEGPGSLTGNTVAVRPGSGKGGVLLVEAGPDAGKSFPVPRSGDTVVGRDSGCGLVLSDGAVSRRHCLVQGTGGGYEVYDMGSRGGTWVEGVALEGQVLPPGAVVTMGHTQLTLMPSAPLTSGERQ